MLKKAILVSTIAFFVSNTLFSATPVETHGALAVSGNRIVGSKNSKPAQVAGMSYYWSIWGGEKYYNRQVVDWLVKDWNITLIRAAMGIEPNSEPTKGYLADPQRQKNLVKAVVDAAIANGIYVIVDWHDHNASRNVDKAKEFFREMAQTYANSPNVIWEIWNEPDDKNGSGTNGFDTWDDIKKYANQVIPAIREYSSNLIVVGTPNWSQNVDDAAKSPLSGRNIAYTLHFYAGTHKSELRSRAEKALNMGIPLFITEFGLTIADGGNTDKTLYTDETKIWLDWADQKGISWANWSIVNHSEASAALTSNASSSGNWSGGDVSKSGQWVRDRLRERPIYGSGPAIDTLDAPGKVEAESFFSKSSELKAETTQDTGGIMNLSCSKSGSWTEYMIKTSETGSYVAQIRVASASDGGAISLKINGTGAASWNIANTGGLQSWETSVVSSAFQLPKGTSTLRVEWSGPANLNWILLQRGASTISKEKKMFSLPIGPLAIRSGFVSFHASDAVKKIAVFTLTGDMLRTAQGYAGTMELPLGKGLHLLRIESRTGELHSIPVVGF